jgi:hypothetical protein
MKPIAWYDPTNGAVSTDKDSPLFTPLGQVLPLYTQQGWVGLTQCGHEETVVKGSFVHCKKCDYCFGVD